MSNKLINDSQTLVGCADRSGYPLRVYDDGFGPIWVGGYQFGPQFVIRAQRFDEAWEIFEDEFADAACEDDVESDYLKDFSEQKGIPWEPGMHISDCLREEFWGWVQDDACFNENYGYRPNGGELYAKDHYFWLEELTPEKLERFELKLEIKDEE